MSAPASLLRLVAAKLNKRNALNAARTGKRCHAQKPLAGAPAYHCMVAKCFWAGLYRASWRWRGMTTAAGGMAFVADKTAG